MTRSSILGAFMCAVAIGLNVHFHKWGWAAYWSATILWFCFNELVLALKQREKPKQV